MTTQPQLKPIGFYLKHLDTLLDREFEHALAGLGLTRRHWQVLHNLAAVGPFGAAALAEKLRPFWGEGAITLDAVTSDLTAREWISYDAGTGTYVATPVGVEAHVEVEGIVKETRVRLLDGVTDDEYTATVAVLARMCTNMEDAGHLL
jgi:hypothetical protein